MNSVRAALLALALSASAGVAKKPPPPKHVTVAAAEVPGFQLTTGIQLDVRAPFEKIVVLDSGKPQATVDVLWPKTGRSVKIYRPAMMHSLDDLIGLERLGQIDSPDATVSRDGSCAWVENPKDSDARYTVDCALQSPGGFVLCTYGDTRAEVVRTARVICESVRLE